jgi:hypothetical protein
MVDTNLFSLYVIPEMMKFDIEVFCPRPILVNSGHFESSRCCPQILDNVLGPVSLKSDYLSSSFPSEVPSLGLQPA